MTIRLDLDLDSLQTVVLGIILGATRSSIESRREVAIKALPREGESQFHSNAFFNMAKLLGMAVIGSSLPSNSSER